MPCAASSSQHACIWKLDVLYEHRPSGVAEIDVVAFTSSIELTSSTACLCPLLMYPCLVWCPTVQHGLLSVLFSYSVPVMYSLVYYQ